MAALLMPAFTLAQPQPSDRSSAGLNDNLLASSLEELTQIQITSVARHQESLLQAAASVYVITADDIHRSGATTLPEVLRLAPTLQVARIDSVQYAITARGFNNTIGNKLLVLIDGRTVYTPMFSGVFWEMQDTMLEDIDRIEVISGPGATLWGANAVNGVINIITRPVAPHESTLVSADAGNQEQGAAVRGGGTLDGDVRWRAYARTRRWDETELESGAPVLNRYQRQQAGFRADWQRGSDDFTLQGDVFDGESEQRGTVGTITIPPLEGSGANLLARWDRHWSADSSLQVQAYWNHNDRREFVLFSPESDIYDIELQQNFALGSHRLVWGGGYRLGEDDVGDGFITGLRPQQSNLEWKDVYLQDEFPLAANLKLTTGLKLEWNDYTGMEYLPTLRLGWTVSANDFLWAAASRAVRAPSRYDRDVYFPQNPPYIVAGGPNFVSEVAKVYEVGYRGLIGSALQLSVTLYRHDWDKLRSGTPPPLPTYLANGIEGPVWGAEAWLNWQVKSGWRIGGGLTTLDKDLSFSPGSSDTVGVNNPTLQSDPHFQWTLRSDMDIGRSVMLQLDLRHVGALTVQPVPAYTELDARLAWSPTRSLELALTGDNLLHASHAEFGAAASRSLVFRSVALGIRWTY